LVSSCPGELAQLDAGHLGTDAWRELLDLAAFREEIFESGVCVFAMLDVVEWLQRRVLLSVVPGWQILRVLESVNVVSSIAPEYYVLLHQSFHLQDQFVSSLSVILLWLSPQREPLSQSKRQGSPLGVVELMVPSWSTESERRVRELILKEVMSSR
jgi:hypothetical protein